MDRNGPVAEPARSTFWGTSERRSKIASSIQARPMRRPTIRKQQDRPRVQVEFVGDLETIRDPYAAAEWVHRLEADPRAMRRWGGVEVRHARLLLTVLGSRPRPSSVRPLARTREQRPTRRTRTRCSSRAGPD